KKPKNEYLAFLPLLLILPLLIFPFVSMTHRVEGSFAFLFSLIIALTAGVRAYFAAHRKGLTTMDDMPWIVQRMPIVHVFYQFKHAYMLPKEAGTWVLIEILGFVCMVLCGVITQRVISRDASEIAAKIQQGPQGSKENGKVEQP